MKKQGGTIANKNGSELENFIESVLDRKGYQFIIPSKFIALSKACEQPFYTKQFYIGQGIYDTPRKCDFIIYHPIKQQYFLVIECKWQQSGGSVDEKYPYLVENIKISKYKTIIVLDGNGYKPKALEWLKQQKSEKLLDVFNMMEFQRWANLDNI